MSSNILYCRDLRKLQHIAYNEKCNKHVSVTNEHPSQFSLLCRESWETWIDYTDPTNYLSSLNFEDFLVTIV